MHKGQKPEAWRQLNAVETWVARRRLAVNQKGDPAGLSEAQRVKLSGLESSASTFMLAGFLLLFGNIGFAFVTRTSMPAVQVPLILIVFGVAAALSFRKYRALRSQFLAEDGELPGAWS